VAGALANPTSTLYIQTGTKRCLPLVRLANADLVITITNIQSCEVSSTAQELDSIDFATDQVELRINWIALDGELIKTTLVHTKWKKTHLS